MSPLPENKKTPGEIAELRDKLGVPAAPNENPAPPPPEPAAKLTPGSAPAFHSPAPVGDAPEVEIDPASGLPMHRHSEQELADLRRRGMFETQNEALRLPVRRARTIWVVAGYLLAASAAVPAYREILPLLTLTMSLTALAYAVFLFFFRAYSRHHGAFISVVVLFVMIYAALQYFPQLRHAT